MWVRVCIQRLQYKCIYIDINTDADVDTAHVHNPVGVHLVAMTIFVLEESLVTALCYYPGGGIQPAFPFLPAFAGREQLTSTFHPDYSLSGLKM